MDNTRMSDLGDRSELGIGQVHHSDPSLLASDGTEGERGLGQVGRQASQVQVRLKKFRVCIKRLRLPGIPVPLRTESRLQRHHSEKAAASGFDSSSSAGSSSKTGLNPPGKSSSVRNGRYSPDSIVDKVMMMSISGGGSVAEGDVNM